MNGYTAESPKHFMLDSGAFYKNFDMAIDTVATASAKLLGLTRVVESFPQFLRLDLL